MGSQLQAGGLCRCITASCGARAGAAGGWGYIVHTVRSTKAGSVQYRNSTGLDSILFYRALKYVTKASNCEHPQKPQNQFTKPPPNGESRELNNFSKLNFSIFLTLNSGMRGAWVLAAMAVAMAGVRAAPVAGGCDPDSVAAGGHCVCKPATVCAGSK